VFPLRISLTNTIFNDCQANRTQSIVSRSTIGYQFTVGIDGRYKLTWNTSSSLVKATARITFIDILAAAETGGHRVDTSIAEGGSLRAVKGNATNDFFPCLNAI